MSDGCKVLQNRAPRSPFSLTAHVPSRERDDISEWETKQTWYQMLAAACRKLESKVKVSRAPGSGPEPATEQNKNVGLRILRRW